MQNNHRSLLIEINNFSFKFNVISIEKDNLKILYSDTIENKEVFKNEISNFDTVINLLKKTIFKIEQKLKYVFKEAVIIIENLESSVINISGYKKLNGSQLVKENITYIINSLKSKINEIEKDKTILHIFNSKFNLDNVQVENLPIGLFGNFYSHELSFFLINSNYFNNINNIFSKCNLRIKKIISKSFVDGVKIIDHYIDTETFFTIKIEKNNSQIIFFENSSLKFIQNFKFGSSLVFNDISKITGLKIDIIKKILLNTNFLQENLKNEYLGKEYFEDQKFKKIDKQLILDVANARIKEFAEIMIFKNYNLRSFLDKKKTIFLKIDDNLSLKFFLKNYVEFFSYNNFYKLKFIENSTNEEFCENAHKIVQYGWKREAVPIIQENKSIMARIFDLISLK